MSAADFLDRRNHQLLLAEAESGYGRRPVYAACTTIAGFIQQVDCFLISAPPVKTRVFAQSGSFLRPPIYWSSPAIPAIPVEPADLADPRLGLPRVLGRNLQQIRPHQRV